MKKYIFINKTNSNIQIVINANSYTEAMELLLAITRYIEDFKLIN